MNFDFALNIFSAGRMMVVDVDLKAGFVQQVGKFADAAGLAGIHQDQLSDALEVDAVDIYHIEQIYHRIDEKIFQVFFLGTRKDYQSIGIQLLSGKHGGQRVKIGIHVGGYNRNIFIFNDFILSHHCGNP